MMHAFDVLGDPVRRRILELLTQGELASGEVVEVISKEFGITQSAVSQQLRILRDNGFASVRAEGTRRLYSVDARPLAEVDAWLDQFRRFWAIETLSGNWDSYSGNTNNFYLYHHPGSDRLLFLPWGTDTAFTGGSIIDAYNQTLTVYATGALANRLYNLPDERERFRALLGELNDSLWDADALEARLDELATLSSDAWPG